MAAVTEAKTLCLSEMARILTWSWKQTSNGGEHDLEQYEATEFTASRQFEYTNAAHLFLYAVNDEYLWEVNKKSAAILMQMRFDGQVGFSGGLLDSREEAPHDGLNRELREELGLDVTKYGVTQADHLISHVNHSCKFVAHLYAKQVSMKEFLEIEEGTQKAQDWGGECLGTIRVPLYRLPHKKTGLPSVRGLPTFLHNQFAGNARYQLAHALHALDIMPKQQLTDCILMYADLRGVPRS